VRFHWLARPIAGGFVAGLFYLGPFDKDPLWIWKGQWRLDSWQDCSVTLIALVGSILVALRVGHSVEGVFNRRADRVVVGVLRGWQSALQRRLRPDDGWKKSGVNE
jgi:hypothetical protein